MATRLVCHPDLRRLIAASNGATCLIGSLLLLPLKCVIMFFLPFVGLK